MKSKKFLQSFIPPNSHFDPIHAIRLQGDRHRAVPLPRRPFHDEQKLQTPMVRDVQGDVGLGVRFPFRVVKTPQWVPVGKRQLAAHGRVGKNQPEVRRHGCRRTRVDSLHPRRHVARMAFRGRARETQQRNRNHHEQHQDEQNFDEWSGFQKMEE